jgi:hypothetical protein
MRVVPSNGDMDEPLEKVAFLGRGRAPDVLQHLVCREVLAGLDQREPALEL